jgi:hypothetical protein
MIKRKFVLGIRDAAYLACSGESQPRAWIDITALNFSLRATGLSLSNDNVPGSYSIRHYRTISGIGRRVTNVKNFLFGDAV